MDFSNKLKGIKITFLLEMDKNKQGQKLSLRGQVKVVMRSEDLKEKKEELRQPLNEIKVTVFATLVLF